MHKQILLASLLITGLFIQGCAHGKIEKEIDTKLSQETKTPTQAELSAQADEMIQGMPGLTAQQKAQLAALKIETRANVKKATDESLKLRSILIKDLAATKYNRAEVNLLKTKIKNVEKERVVALLDGVEKANVILGRETSENEKKLNDIYFDFLIDQSYRQK